MSKEDFSAEAQEEKDGFFYSQAQSEFQQIIKAEKYRNRRSKVLFLRSLGREERKLLSQKNRKRWQDVI